MRSTFAFSLLLFFLISGIPGLGQVDERCGTVPYMKMQEAQNSALKQKVIDNEIAVQAYIKGRSSRADRVTRLIPVVVHIIWHEPYQNLCDDVIRSQIDVLNEDFARLNSDTVNTPVPFRELGEDSGIRFVLANRDPDGNVTTGIIRSYADSATFDFGNEMKFEATGGQDQWDPERYLNIWVCNMGNSVLGYSTLPGAANPGEDGLVIATRAFGRKSYDPSGKYNLGRTTTHEVGHWLDLFHIWGDDNGCSPDDQVDDTPRQDSPTYHCPSYPQLSCSNGPEGNMFMNYMDYSDDRCMNIFSKGQIQRMQAALDTLRPTILVSNGYVPDSTINPLSPKGSITVVPNPFETSFDIVLRLSKVSVVKIDVLDLAGKILYRKEFPECFCQTFHIDMSAFSRGVYLARIESDQETFVTKLFKSR